MQEAMTALAADTDVDAELAIKDRYSWAGIARAPLLLLRLARVQLLLTGSCHLLYFLTFFYLPAALDLGSSAANWS